MPKPPPVHSPAQPAWRVVAALALTLLAPAFAAAQTFFASDTASLAAAISNVNASGGTVVLTDNIALTASLPSVDIASGLGITVEGGGFTLSGANAFQGLTVINSLGSAVLPAVIQNLAIANTVIVGGGGGNGGAGAAGGGGGAAAGGALTIAVGATVNVNNVSLVSNGAVGGAGGNGSAIGGFGNGGTGGAFNTLFGGGGAGGIGNSISDGGNSSGFGGGGGAAQTAGTGGYGNFNATVGPVSGGGAGGSTNGISATSLYGGGSGGTAVGGVGAGGGGGGAAFGGGVFVQAGGQLTISGPFFVNGNAVTGGAGGAGGGGGTSGAAGSGLGGGLFLDGGFLDVNTNSTVTISDSIGGEGASVQTSGTGTLVLGGNNTYTGGTNIAAGTLSISSDANLGSGGTLSLGVGSTLAVTASGTYTHDVALGTIATIAPSAGQTVVWNGAIFDSAVAAALIVNGGGTLALGNVNSYGAGTIVTGNSTLSVSDDLALGNLSGSVALGDASSGGTLAVTTAGTFSSARLISLGAGGGTIDASAATDATLSGEISGSGGLTKAGAGALTLSGISSYTGPTTVNAGTLRAAGSFTFGTNPVLAIASAGTVDFNGISQNINALTGTGALALNSASMTIGATNLSSVFDGTISGSGGITKIGSGLLTLGGTNTFSGGVAVNGGGLSIGADTNLGSGGSLALADQTSLTITGSGVFGHDLLLAGRPLVSTRTGTLVTWNGLVANGTSNGTVQLTGGGTLALGNAANTYSGGTIVTGGSAVLVGADGALGAAGTAVTLGDATSSGTLAIDSANAFSSFRPIGLGAAGGAIRAEGSTNATLSGVITGQGGLTKDGSGTLTLLGANTYSGGTTVSGGTLIGNTTSLQGAIANNAAVTFDQGAAGTYAAVMSGTGSLTKAGGGMLTLTGANSYSGLTRVLDGTLATNAGLPGSVFVGSGGTLRGAGVIGGSLNLAGTLFVPTPLSPFATFIGANAGLSEPAATNAPSLFIGGDLIATQGSTVGLTMSSDGTAPVVVNGRADFVGTHFSVTVDDPNPSRSATFLAVSAAGGVNVAGSDASSPSTAIVPVLQTSSSALLITLLNLNVPLAGVATTSGARAAGGGLDRGKFGAVGDFGAVVREVTALDDRHLDEALRSLSGEVHASQVRLTALDGLAMTDAIRGVLADQEQESESNPKYQARGLKPRFWFELTGEHVSFDSGAFSGGTANVGGGASGLDFKPAANVIVGGGMGLGLGQMSLSEVSGSGRMQAPRAFGYTGVGIGPFHFHGGGSASRAKTKSQRDIQFAAMVPDENGQLVPLSNGVDRAAASEERSTTRDAWSEWQDTFKFSTWTLDGKVGVRAAHYDGKAFTESGADSISLDGATQDMKMRESHVEVHLFRRSGGWRPNILVNYRRELGDKSTQADVRFAGSPDSQFAVQGLPLPVNTFSGLFGLAMRTGSGLEYTLEYRTQQAKGESHHSVSFKMRFR